MTNEEKQLLLKDLCARLPYRVLISYNNEIRPLFGVEPTQHYVITLDNEINGKHNGLEYCTMENIKPYLRPMSSMTEEEKEEVRLYFRKSIDELKGKSNDEQFILGFCQDAIVLDILNKHHLDYRGLIEKGLALEVPEGMY